MDIKNVMQSTVDPYRSRIDSEQQVQVQRSRQAERAAQPQEGRGDRVSVSPEARLRTEAYQTAMNTQDVRQEKIDAIKERIASGEYSIDSRSIAGKILQNESELAGTIKE